MTLKNAVKKYLSDHIPAKVMMNQMEQIGRLYLIGGVLREYQDHKDIRYLRDIDIVIDVLDEDKWKRFLQEYQPTINEFGGYKFICEGLVFDSWRIEETWAFRNHIISFSSGKAICALADSVYLNLDSIVYDWTNDIWKMDKYQKAMESKILDIVLEKNPRIALNLSRACILRERYNMKFSTSLENVTRNYIRQYDDENEGIKHICEAARKRYVEHGNYTETDIDHIVRKYLKRYGNLKKG